MPDAASMRQRIALDELYEDARALVQAETVDGQPLRSLPAVCPFALGDLSVDRPGVPDVEALVRKVAGEQPGGD